MARTAKLALLFFAGGAALAVPLFDVLMPRRQPPVAVIMPDGWMSTAEPSHRGYFRHTLEIPFRPRHAWIGIAAEEYRLMVNGRKIGQNVYLLRTGTAFQDRLGDKAQSLTRGNAFPRGGGAALAKAAKREWRVVHFHDLRAHLQPGRNVLAIEVESPTGLSRLAVVGSVEGEVATLAISGDPSAWRAQTEADNPYRLPWFDPETDDLAWPPAERAAPPEELPLYATAEPDLWRQPFRAPVITASSSAEEQIFRTRLTAVGAWQTGWLRVASNWPYDLFIDAGWVGRGGGHGRIDAFDVSAQLARTPRQITVRMHRERTADDDPSIARLAVDGAIGALPISSAVGWSRLAAYHPDWLAGDGAWLPATAQPETGDPGPINYRVARQSSWTWLLPWLGAALGLGLALAAVAWVLRRLGRGAAAGGAAPSGLALGCWLLAPALLGLLVYDALRWRFAESDQLLAFLDPSRGWAFLVIAPALLLVSLVWLTRPAGRRPPLAAAAAWAARVPPLAWLALICLLGLALRSYALEFQPPGVDDYTSWDAARGILERGVPEATSGILYTRSPLFHYLLAGWMALFGESLASVRSFALLPGLAVIPATYLLVAAIARRPLPALIAALALALDPWLLGITNLIRFYQLMQLFAVLAVFFFLKGFVWREGKRHQNLFFVVAAAAVLSQEIYIATLAPFAVVLLLCYRPFHWREDSNVWLGGAAMLFVAWLDLRVFSTLSLTPHVVIATASESLSVPHLVDVFGGSTNVLVQLAIDFFWMNNGENAFWSLLFFAGLPYWLRRADRAMLTLYAVVLMSVAVLAVLVVPINGRYAYSAYPLLVATAILTADHLIRRVAAGGFGAGALAPPARRRWAALAAGILIAAWFGNAEFDKVSRSYASYREIDWRRGFDYVAAHRRPGDKLVSVRTPAASVVFGGIDYYAMVRPAFDGLYQRRHGIVDRWSGGELLWKVDQFRDVFLHNERVWVIVDEPRWPRMNPGVARFLRAACKVESEFFGGRVLLWERAAGRFATAPDYGGQAGGF